MSLFPGAPHPVYTGPCHLEQTQTLTFFLYFPGHLQPSTHLHFGVSVLTSLRASCVHLFWTPSSTQGSGSKWLLATRLAETLTAVFILTAISPSW